jgi:lipopolysaccharide transport system permease protein
LVDDGGWDLCIDAQRVSRSWQLAELWRYRDLLYLFVRRDIVAFYKQTLLGPLWLAIQPVLTTVVYMLVFGQIAGLSTDGLPQLLFYLSGVTLWNYFAECLSKTATVFRDNAPLFGKVYFPRIIAPVSIVVSSLFRFAIQFSLFLGALVWYLWWGTVSTNWVALVFPLVLFDMALIGLSLGMIVSSLTSKYRDLIFLLQFGVQLLMFATPVIYPASEMSPSVRSVLAWNPLYPLIETTRYGFLGAGDATAGGIIYATMFALIACTLATLLFHRVERTLMDTV